jgi:transcription elongation factor S-II
MNREETIKNLKKYFDTKIAKKIETSIFKFSNEYAEMNEVIYLLDTIYQDKMNEIMTYLSNDKNLIKLIKDNKLDPTQIAFMKAEELNPQKYETIKKKKELEDSKKQKVGTNMYKCKKCGKSNSITYLRQTRSGDEPPTLFVECLECGHTFRG